MGGWFNLLKLESFLTYSNIVNESNVNYSTLLLYIFVLDMMDKHQKNACLHAVV